MNYALGPFVGHTTKSSSKIWIYTTALEKMFCVINDNKLNKISFERLHNEIPVYIAEIESLNQFTKYKYTILNEFDNEIKFEGLNSTDLFFTTMPDDNSQINRFDFLLMSCNDPILANESKEYKDKGYALWEKLPTILNESVSGTESKVMIGLLGGDQVYSDSISDKVFNCNDPKERLLIYIDNYKKYWGNLSYRKALCSLPCYLMWDDHDIIDGWGSREESFDNQNNFLPEWKNLFESAKEAFAIMQASRNPTPLTKDGFDFGIRVGPIGIIGADLRSNRNSRKGMMWTEKQFNAFKEWIKLNQNELEVLFFLSPVVFAHGAEIIDEHIIIQNWGNITSFFNFIQSKTIHYFLISFSIWVFAFLFSIKLGIVAFLTTIAIKYWLTPLFFNKIGDLRDDINDSWGAEVNSKIAEEFLDYAFGLQNEEDVEKRIHFVILSGDIHTGGYSMIYSNEKSHESRPVIPHIVSSPVAYLPFPWIGEAFYRKFTKGGAIIGPNKKYQAQISHHFTERNVVVCSLRRKDNQVGSFILKAKYYLEGYPEPQIVTFDLDKSSHREKIKW